MSGYLNRLVERASPPAAVPVPAPTAPRAVLDDPFESAEDALPAAPATPAPQITERQIIVPAAPVVHPQQTRAIRVTSGEVPMHRGQPEVRGMPQEERREVRAEIKPPTSPEPRYAPPAAMSDTADENRSLAPQEPPKNDAIPPSRSPDRERELALAMADRFMASMRARTSLEPEMRPSPPESTREPVPPAPREITHTVERELAPPLAPSREAHPQASPRVALPQPAGAGAWIGSLSVEVAAPPPERPVTSAPAPQGRTIVVGAGRKPGGRLRSFSRFQLGQV